MSEVVKRKFDTKITKRNTRKSRRKLEGILGDVNWDGSGQQNL